MGIEYQQQKPAFSLVYRSATANVFYNKILSELKKINPILKTDRQIERIFSFGRLFKIDSLEKFEEALGIISLQNDGCPSGQDTNRLPRYYRFGEIFNGHRFVKDQFGNLGYFGAELSIPDVHDMYDIPPGGYLRKDVPDAEVWELIERFDGAYSEMLRRLQEAWCHGRPALLGQAVIQLFEMADIGQQLVATPRPDRAGNYGPCFRFVP